MNEIMTEKIYREENNDLLLLNYIMIFERKKQVYLNIDKLH